MNRRIVVAIMAISTVAFWQCGPAVGDPVISISARPLVIDNMGGSTELTITATDGLGKAGTGQIALTSAAGDVTNVDATLDADGKAVTSFRCNVNSDPKCTGRIRIGVEWKSGEKTATASVNVTVTGGEDAGVGGGAAGGGSGGSGGGDAGGTATGGGSGGGSVNVGDGGLTITLSKSKVYQGVGDTARVTASLFNNTVPAANVPLRFGTSLGALGLPDAGPGIQTLTVNTDTAGNAVVIFHETGAAGTATVAVTDEATGRTASATLEVLGVQQIRYVSTTCGGATACTIMGIRGSGFNEVANVKFHATDTTGDGVAGVQVAFSIANAPAGTTVSATGVTDMNGDVVANVSAGASIGAITVKAVVIPGSIEATSPTIGIRGAVPVNKGFNFQCDTVNIAAYKAAVPPAQFSITCRLKLVDRYGNPVGTGSPVNLKSEAGTISNSVMTTPYSPTSTNMDEGKGSVTFDTAGTFPPLNVGPLPAVPGQYPFARTLEPSWDDGPVERNPRDGLVTIIAYVRGEEFFSDNNQNGIRDANEPFVDQGEPFVDRDDNGVWDPGEVYIDEAPADGQWNPPNGRWDSNTSIWTEAHVLYTDNCKDSQVYLTPNTFNVSRGTVQSFTAYMPDLNLNRVQASSTTTSARHTATKGSVQFVTNPLQDGFGFRMERTLVNASTGGECLSTTPICVYRMLFGDWSKGLVGTAELTGAAITDTTPPQGDNVFVETTVLGVKVGAQASGIVQ